MKKIVIVGGGIAGLTLAYRLEGKADVTLVEALPRLGGTIETVRQDGYLIEGGPDAFITAKPWGVQLCKELGLEDRLLPMSRQKFFVYSSGRLQEFPPGVFLTVPTDFRKFAKTKLISPLGKARAALDLALPRGLARDESIGSFVRRRFGREILEKLAEPLMAGIFVAPADLLSLQATFPRFADLERKHRSLILALRNFRPGAHSSPFLTLRGGLGEMIEALHKRLKKTRVILGKAAVALEPGWKVQLPGETLPADDVILAIPAPHAAELVLPFAPELSRAVDAIRTTSTATVSMAYPVGDIPGELNGTGFVIPKREKRRILASTWSSLKFDGRAPDGHVLLRCFLGGFGREESLKVDDRALIDLCRSELAAIMGIKAAPELTRVFRWPLANPIYEVGHLDRVPAIETLCPTGLTLAGSPFRGSGIPDCIHDAGRIARRLADS